MLSVSTGLTATLLEFSLSDGGGVDMLARTMGEVWDACLVLLGWKKVSNLLKLLLGAGEPHVYSMGPLFLFSSSPGL